MQVLVSNETDDEVGVELLRQTAGLEVLTYDPNQDLPASHHDAEILIPPYRSSHRPLKLLGQLPNLKMVQLLSAGADEWSSDVPSDITLASARGAHAGPVSEWVLSAILCLYRQWPALVRYQQESVWAHRRVDADTLSGKKALILGAGSIGNAIAERLAAFGATSSRVASRARGDVYGPESVHDLLPDHHIVAITAPLTDDTRGLVDESFLAAMPDGATLVNAGRGKIVNTDALYAETQSGRLRAALDVTDPEPLPESHPLWTCPGVIISPHMARTVPGTNKLCYTVAAEQLSAFIAGQVPSNAVTSHASHR
ncbi:2-hydroxyacid dehydrogenase [Amycolatopsis cihanbeyliensis]|uniref:Phosphoglycerate dehydrogenase-like enzyme n=1 Tax=Amycolatopsis cihanbeyliensis TaxID=1128664 RepID=A0A542DR61_AMYCI|nr:2-hydroxyacid dehydrogenase [Amycolatopsis cihanbeyliensis]TQJ05455.1 phosphoglycerate dehydrogenase-like enzyme [Amycolatopsis cihanbeyliensis]